MASRNTDNSRSSDDAITRGTGNVFADLGYADASTN
jgi:hypothetical protein